jgi:beta-lactamase class C
MRHDIVRVSGWAALGILGIGLAREASAQGFVSLTPTPYCFAQLGVLDLYIGPLVKPAYSPKSFGTQAVGAMVVMLKLGEKPCFYSSGEIVLETGKAPDADTVFELASVTKVFTTAILGVRSSQGLKVHDQVEPYLPPGYALTPSEHKVTFQQLATFTGGFSWSDPPDFTKGHAFSQAEFVDDVNSIVPDPDDPIPGVTNLPTNVNYSNGSVGFLGQILMQMDSTRSRPYDFDASGFSDWISDNVTEPLDMGHTRVHPNGTVAIGYKPKGSTYIVPVDSPFPWVPWGAAGALRSTTADMAKFFKANICAHNTTDPACTGYSVDLLDGLSVSHQPNKYSPSGTLVDPTIYIGGCESRSEQAWAWVYVAPPSPNPSGVTPIIWKNGGHPGFSTFIGFSPDKKLGLVILTNTGGIALINPGKNVIQHSN